MLGDFPQRLLGPVGFDYEPAVDPRRDPGLMALARAAWMRANRSWRSMSGNVARRPPQSGVHTRKSPDGQPSTASHVAMGSQSVMVTGCRQRTQTVVVVFKRPSSRPHVPRMVAD